MRVLIIGGTGLISTGIIKHLHARGADITMLNRGRSTSRIEARVQLITCDRDDIDAFERACRAQTYDAVIDMICYTPQQAQSDVRAFAGRCGHFIFCSTVCTYGRSAVPSEAT